MLRMDLVRLITVSWVLVASVVAGGKGEQELASDEQIAKMRAMAGRLAEEARKAAQTLKEERTEEARARARRTRQEAKHARISVEMMELRRAFHGKSPDARFTFLIECLLQDPNERVRSYATQIVGTKYVEDVRYGPHTSMQRQGEMPLALRGLLIDTMRQDSSSKVRSCASFALRNSPDPAVTQALLGALRDPEEMVRSSVKSYFARAYGKELGASHDIWGTELQEQKEERDRLLERITRRTPDLELLDSIRQYFVPAGDRRIVGPLLNVAKQPETDRFVAVRALEIVSALADEEFVQDLIELLGDHGANRLVRAKAASALAHIGTETCVGTLLDALRDQGSPDAVRIRTIHALGDLPIDRMGPSLVAALGDENSLIRNAAAMAITSLRGPDANELLLGCLRHESPLVRAEAARIVARRKTPGSLDLVLGLLTDSDESVREAATGALGSWRDERVVASLLAMYDQGAPRLQAMVVSSLAWSKSPAVVQTLTRAISHRDRQVRLAATTALGKLQPDEAFDLLSKVLGEHEAASVREAAVKSLGALNDPRVPGLLLKIAGDPKEAGPFRSLALYSLRRHAGKIETATLLKLLAEPDIRVSYNAAYLLGEGKHEGAIGALIKRLRDEDGSMRSGAYLALRKITGRTEPEPEKWEAWWKDQRGR